MTGINLNGKTYSAQAIYDYAAERLTHTLPEWETMLYQFLQQWFDPNTDTVPVQTSGSTGPAKHTELEKSAMINSAQLTNSFLGLTATTNALLCLPAKYIGGKMMLVRAIVGQYAIHTVMPSASPLSSPIAVSIDFCAMTPMQAAQSMREFPARFEAIKQVILGGGTISSTVMSTLSGIKNKVYQTFGMTETISHIALRQLTPNFEENYHTLTGIRVSQDERNCLQVHAPELGHQTLTTNDVVEIKSDTCFSWLGRWDDIINSGGIKINPSLMEEKLAPYITARFVISYQPHPSLIEELILIVEGPGWDNKEKEALLEKIKSIIGTTPRPKQLYFMASFPETETGKIQRSALREACWKAFNLNQVK